MEPEDKGQALVIEDNTDNFHLIEYALKRGGYSVKWAKNGEEGIEAVKENVPGLIIMDINMPGIDGLETTRRIRQMEDGHRVPIIAITSYAMMGDREKALAAGCDGYLEKPIDPLTVVESIEAIIARSRGNEAK